MIGKGSTVANCRIKGGVDMSDASQEVPEPLTEEEEERLLDEAYEEAASKDD